MENVHLVITVLGKILPALTPRVDVSLATSTSNIMTFISVKVFIRFFEISKEINNKLNKVVETLVVDHDSWLSKTKDDSKLNKIYPTCNNSGHNTRILENLFNKIYINL